MMDFSIFPYYLTQIGRVVITDSVATTWGLMLVMTVGAWLSTRMLRLFPGLYQTLLEGIYLTIEDAIKAVLPDKYLLVLPFIATLWLFILISNLLGIIPGLSSPTADLSVTAGLAVLVFLSVHWFGIRVEGLRQYLGHYLKPNPILLPFYIISEISRTIALAVRLFGNMMSLQFVVFLLLLIAGFLIPIPLLMLHIVEAVIQAYIFGMLALIFIASGLQSHEVTKTTAQQQGTTT
jgi:F-type H+-transporting ATPase subunit a